MDSEDIEDIDDIAERYAQLRLQLDEAYTRLPGSSQHIDRIAGEMLPLERALAARHSTWDKCSCSVRPADPPARTAAPLGCRWGPP
ncbi:hypothetical protein [Aquabacterium sp.]|uniref:hypothetical protein n=1 Tax=Aquabacterium sp. TaxID=1872578 RepID=UPI002D097A85|nr:hypothetical protein [Aquabacterium sp.]HSW04295.1 hypothetical protein [Aquabacterium sp.]